MTKRVVLAVAILAAGMVACGAKGPVYDLVIVNGRIVDGSGAAGFDADVAITGDTIAKIGPIDAGDRARARKLIDAHGLTVTPGFIDIHTHSDYPLLADGTAQSAVRQGVTTDILGESDSAGPIQGKVKKSAPYGITVDWRSLGEYLSRLESRGISINVGSFVGATQVRRCVIGDESREPTPAEMAEMKHLVEEAMQEGAFGLSCALLVPPNTYHTTPQLIELASVVKPFGGIFLIHIRTEGEGIDTAVKEALEVGEKAQVPVEILHLKIADRRLWGRMKDICDLIENARSRGIKASANQYPYVAGQNNLVALVPPWAMEGGRGNMVRRLKNPADRRRIEKDLYAGHPGLVQPLPGDERLGRVPGRVGQERREQTVRREVGCGHRKDHRQETCRCRFRPARRGGRLSSGRLLPDERGRRALRDEGAVGVGRVRRLRRPPRRAARAAANRTRAGTARFRACWASTCARTACCRSKTRCAR